jgi:sarcosine oxidase subunit alpha
VENGSRRFDCDFLAVSGGWNPALDMHCQSGAKAQYDAAKACFVPGAPVQAERSAGSCNGSFGLRSCLREGIAAGAAAAHLAGFGDPQPQLPLPDVAELQEQSLQPVWMIPSRFPVGRGPKQFVDFQNDTTVGDLAMALHENYRSIEHIKRYTLLGFGTEQGKLGNVNGIGIIAELSGRDIPSIGTTRFRPAYSPVTFGALAGRDIGLLFDPIRKTPMHEWHVAAGATFENVGQWRRAWYYPRSTESMEDAVRRECLATQCGVGILDYSTLGKIDVQGPDAGRFLDLLYTNNKSQLAAGRCNYGFLLTEEGMLLDDGVTACLAENHFFVTTTSGGAARVMAWMERWLQTEWPELRVYLTSVTDHWANISVNGPQSRALISELSDDIDFSREAFPFMSFRDGILAGIPARVFRVSFSGELAYEINVPADYGLHVWDALIAAGQKYQITPYGTETMHVLRADKGYIIAGQDTDGSVTPVDLGMSWILSKNKEFLGKRSLSRSDMLREDRKQLVGLLPEDPAEVLPEGGQIVARSSISIPMLMEGHVTSSYYSARVGRSIALALLKGGRRRHGETVYVPRLDGRVAKVTVSSPVFYDPEGRLQNA